MEHKFGLGEEFILQRRPNGSDYDIDFSRFGMTFVVKELVEEYLEDCPEYVATRHNEEGYSESWWVLEDMMERIGGPW